LFNWKFAALTVALNRSLHREGGNLQGVPKVPAAACLGTQLR